MLPRLIQSQKNAFCASRESGLIYWIRDLNEGVKAKKKGGVPLLGLGAKKISKPLWSGPLLANNRVIVVGQLGELVAINAKTGAVEKRVNLGAPALLSPIAMGDTIYVVTDEAQLIALR